MTNTEGAFVSETLFIPKYVWYQRDAKVPEVERKLDYLEALKREFQKVAILFNKKSLSKDKNEVDKLMMYVMYVQESMSKDLNPAQGDTNA